MIQPVLDSVPTEPYSVLQDGVFTPQAVAGCILAARSGLASPLEAAVHQRAAAAILQAYTLRDSSERIRHKAVLLHWFHESLSVRQIAAHLGIPQRTAQNWIESFCRFAAGWLNRQQWRDRERELLRWYCEQTHQQKGGDGRTPPIGRREWSAGTCPACAALRA